MVYETYFRKLERGRVGLSWWGVWRKWIGHHATLASTCSAARHEFDKPFHRRHDIAQTQTVLDYHPRLAQRTDEVIACLEVAGISGGSIEIVINPPFVRDDPYREICRGSQQSSPGRSNANLDSHSGCSRLAWPARTTLSRLHHCYCFLHSCSN